MDCSTDALMNSSKCFFKCVPRSMLSAIRTYLICQWLKKNNPDCTLPSAPGDLGASAGDNQVTLTWPAVGGATSYNIKRSLTTGTEVTIANTAASPYVDLTAVNGTEYFYVVSAVNACGESGNSIEDQVTPPGAFFWSPPTAQIHWQDAGGVHAGDWATFHATAVAPVIVLNFDIDPVTFESGLQFLPALQAWFGNVGPTSGGSLDFTGNPLLVQLDCTSSGVTSLNVTGLTVLNLLNCGTNSLTAITGLNDCTALVTLACNDNQLTGTLNLTGLASLFSLQCQGNPALTALTLTGLSALNDLDCTSCNITGTLNVSPCTSLASLSCVNNPSLTALTLTGLTSLQQFDCNSCNITGTLDVSPLTAMQIMNCAGNPALTALTLTGLSMLTDLACNLCNITGTLDVSTCVNILIMDCSDNGMLTAGVDGTLSALVTAALFNGGGANLDGTNQAPTSTGPGSSYDTLTTAGWGVTVTP